jgi:hypothetical protein
MMRAARPVSRTLLFLNLTEIIQLWANGQFFYLGECYHASHLSTIPSFPSRSGSARYTPPLLRQARFFHLVRAF